MRTTAINPFVRSEPSATGCECVAEYLNSGNRFGECPKGDPVAACTPDSSGACQCAYYCPDGGEPGRYSFYPHDVDCPESPPGFGQLPPGAQPLPIQAGVPSIAGVPICHGTVTNDSNRVMLAFADLPGSKAQIPLAIPAHGSSPAGVDVDYLVGVDGRIWKIGPNRATINPGGQIVWAENAACQLAWRWDAGAPAGKCDGMCEAPVGGICQSDC